MGRRRITPPLKAGGRWLDSDSHVRPRAFLAGLCGFMWPATFPAVRDQRLPSGWSGLRRSELRGFEVNRHGVCLAQRQMAKNASAAHQPRLLEQLRLALEVRHYSERTVAAYAGWVRRFVHYYDRRHPREMGPAEVARFLSHLATVERVSASTQNQALAPLLFLYSHVLGQDLGHISGIVAARNPTRLPVVMSRAEVAQLLGAMAMGVSGHPNLR